MSSWFGLIRMDFPEECGIRSYLSVMAFCTRPAVREKKKKKTHKIISCLFCQCLIQIYGGTDAAATFLVFLPPA